MAKTYELSRKEKKKKFIFYFFLFNFFSHDLILISF